LELYDGFFGMDEEGDDNDDDVHRRRRWDRRRRRRRSGSVNGMEGRKFAHRNPRDVEALREQRMMEAIEALGTAAGDYSPDDFRRDSGGKRLRSKKGRKKYGSRSRGDGSGGGVERLREGCDKLTWHDYHFPNCNEIHEIDLRSAMRRVSDAYHDNDRDGMVAKHEYDEDDDDATSSGSNELPWGFVGNGLWRDVFSCDPRGEAAASSFAPRRPPAVLKVMKSEHVSCRANGRDFYTIWGEWSAPPPPRILSISRSPHIHASYLILCIVCPSFHAKHIFLSAL
jgi:hypothetical protein